MEASATEAFWQHNRTTFGTELVMISLINKLLASPPEERPARLARYLRDRTFHKLLLALKRSHYGDFYLQWRPTNEVTYRGLEGIKELSSGWCDTALGLGKDLARVYLFYLNICELDQRGVPGAFAEIGVYKGYTARILAHLAKARTLYLMDTFEGFAEEDVASEAKLFGDAPREQFGDTSVEGVRRYVDSNGHVVFCKGRFPETTAMLPTEERFALVHYDADLYAPAKSACEYFYPRMAPGGLMIFHNYADATYPGTKKAVDEFFSDKPEGVVSIPDQFGSAVVLRNKVVGSG